MGHKRSVTVSLKILHFLNILLRFAVTLPISELTIPARMDDNSFHADELLAAIILVQVILTRHHTVCASIQADSNMEIK